MARSWLISSTLCVSVIVGVTLFGYGRCLARNKRLPDCNVRPKPIEVVSDTADVSTSQDQSRPPGRARELILVSTLDGYVSALDPSNEGNLLWSHETGEGPLLSSSISQLEMNSNGHAVRLIPSLDGNLYKFNGESVEPIPVSADTLLKSSFKVGDDTIITGGKDSSSYGISLHTGELRYSCEINGCHTYGKTVGDDEDILVVRRLSQTVRAITPRSGGERWNFSVGEHHITFLEKLEADCSGGQSEARESFYEEAIPKKETDDLGQVQVIVPEGMIAIFNKGSNELIWSHKFDSPIVHTWHLKDGQLEPIDLFDQKQVLTLQPSDHSNDHPLLYIGRHQKQLYIQNSLSMKKRIQSSLNSFVQTPTGSQLEMPQIEWKPYAISSSSRTPYVNHGKEQPAMVTSGCKKIVTSTTALVLKSADFLEYPYDSGYYLFGSADLRSLNSSIIGEDTEEEENSVSDVIIVSFWHWWKEVLGTALGLAIVMNVFFTRHIVKRYKNRILAENSGSEIQIIPATPTITDSCEEATAEIFEIKEIEVDAHQICEFNSRYLTDFEPIRRLGKGGFGVVFEARNKIDDCHYAVKRILLPPRVRARDKVMREVRALAKLDHSGIVRYFNAWQEVPPLGWQQQHDLQWEDGQVQSGLSSLNELTVSRIYNIEGVPRPKTNNPFKVEEGFSFSQNTTNDKAESAESGSFSLEKGQGDQSLSKDEMFSYKKKNDESLEIVFQSDSAEVCTRHLGTKRKQSVLIESSEDSEIRGPGSKSSGLNSKSQWLRLKGDKQLLEDSGCADRSKSTEEEEVSVHSGEKKVCRPEDLSLSAQKEQERIYLYIQMQLCRKETLKDWLTVHLSRNHDEILDIFDQIVSAVQYVHHCNLMHRDLKPSNIFFSVDGTVKVGDFGLVTALTESEAAHTPSDANQRKMSQVSVGHTDQVGTQLYMSPEQVVSGSYSHKVDIFSLGLIFFELLVPFPTQMERVKALLNVKQHIFSTEFMTKYPNECALVKKLLSHNPLERPSALEIKQNALFAAFQPEPEMLMRYRRRRTLSQRISTSGSEAESPIS